MRPGVDLYTVNMNGRVIRSSSVWCMDFVLKQKHTDKSNGVHGLYTKEYWYKSMQTAILTTMHIRDGADVMPTS